MVYPGSSVVLSPAGGQPITLGLGTISRTQLGAADIRGTGTVTTSTGNTNGIIGGYLTVNGGADWAANNGGGNIVAAFTR